MSSLCFKSSRPWKAGTLPTIGGCQLDKEEKILKCNLNLFSSPSLKIQIMGKKVRLSCEGKTLLGVVNKLLKIEKFVDNAQKCFAFTPQANFPAHILNFHWRWWDQMKAIFLNLFYLNLFYFNLIWHEGGGGISIPWCFWIGLFLDGLSFKNS